MSNVSISTTTIRYALFISTWQDRLLTVGQFCTIGGLGAILNVLPLILTLCTRLRRHEVNIMIMNLSSADFFLCISFLFGQTFYILWHEQLPEAGCHFLSFFHFTMAFASFIFPPTLAINRYISLYYNHIYRRLYTKRNVFRMMGVCWTFCAIVPFIFMMAGKTGYDEDNHHCCMVVHGDIPWTIAYWIVIIAPLLLFCDGTMIYCNYKIYKKLNEHASAQNLGKNIIRKNKEVLYFLIADMMFPICFHSMYHIFKFALVDRTSEFLKRFFISLYLLNSVLRGIVTLGMLRPYRSALHHMFWRISSFVCCRNRIIRRDPQENLNNRITTYNGSPMKSHSNEEYRLNGRELIFVNTDTTTPELKTSEIIEDNVLYEL